jgi:hypothetical protein
MLGFVTPPDVSKSFMVAQLSRTDRWMYLNTRDRAD